MASFGDWTEFAPPVDPQLPTPTGAPVETQETVDEVRQIDDAGEVQVIRDVAYTCTETPYSLTNSPREMVMNDPNRDILYPGALLQGKTHRDGANVGDLLPLTIVQRAPVRLSIPDVSNPNGSNFRMVAPNQAEISEAVGDIVGNATRDNLNTPSTTAFEMHSYHSEQQFALQAGASGRYLGFRASARGSAEKDASKTTVAVQFAQRMFTAVVEPPGSGPESFFSDEFTAELLQNERDAGRISADNLPVYVSSVVYGRMMTFTITSTASESELKATLRASYNSLAGGGSVNLSTKQHKILEESTVSLSTLGGDQSAALAVIRSGDWSAYFSEDAALSTAAPLSYTFKNLGDGSIASVAETSEFSVKTCVAEEVSPGTFTTKPVQTFDLGLGTVVDTRVADFNGDGVDDIAYNSRSGTDNSVTILYGNGDGTFLQSPTLSGAPAPVNGTWVGYQLQTEDVDGDGNADFAWNYNGDEGGRRSVTYVALSRPDGSGAGELVWAAPDDLDNPSIAEGSYNFFLADLNGDGRADRILNSAGVRTDNYTHIGLSLGDGTFQEVDGAAVKYGGRGYDSYETFIGDYSGDGLPDLVWNARRSSETPIHSMRARTEIRSVPVEQLEVADVFAPIPTLDGWGEPAGNAPLSKDWTGYRTLTGDVSGEGRMDLVLLSELPDAGVSIAAAFGTDSGFAQQAIVEYTVEDLGFEVPPAEDEPDMTAAAPVRDRLTFRLADVAGDDKDDLIVNLRDGAINRVVVGLSNGDGTFDFVSIPQDVNQPEAWGQFQVLTGNFGGSSKQDIAWVLPTSDSIVYVGIAK